MQSCKAAKTLETLGEVLEAARIAAHRFTRGQSPEDREDAAQDAQLAVLEAYRVGRRGTFSYYYTIAERHLMDARRSTLRRQAREFTYTVRQYGPDAVTPTTEAQEQ